MGGPLFALKKFAIQITKNLEIRIPTKNPSTTRFFGIRKQFGFSLGSLSVFTSGNFVVGEFFFFCRIEGSVGIGSRVQVPPIVCVLHLS